MSLIDRLGMDQFLNKYLGSFFKGEDGATYIVFGAGSEPQSVRCKKVGGTVNKPTVEEVDVPNSFFVDMGMFATPPLGWRVAAQGRYLVHLSRNNQSYHRGTCVDNVNKTVHEMTNWFAREQGMSLDYYSRDIVLAKLVMEPVYLPLSEGLALIKKGKIVAFAVSELIAIAPLDSTTYQILFKEKQIGTVNEDGVVSCDIPYVVKSLEQAA
jgi:hypothetical protein